jgi:hypothetical protein
MGIGVTAYSHQQALEWAIERARVLSWTLDASTVKLDIDLSTLDQRHLLPNVGLVTRPGVWYPQ